ncbi:MAG: 3-ketoacyl-ACP reductase [Thermoguttaceae bacterium]|nr:3-ketoacyl-ACP reductase [Thermoguttaceae bacterium]
MKNVLVTGGGRGIGAGVVEALAAESWNVAFCGRKPAEELEERRAWLERRFGVRAVYFQCDVSNHDDRQRLVDSTLEAFGELNALVNNAGVAPLVRADILDATEESFDRVMNINLKGPYFLTQLVAQYMVGQKRQNADFSAAIVNIGSVSATVASVSRGEYCISKAGVAMATLLWAVRLAEFGIPVYEVRPGIIKSDVTAAVTAKYDKLIAEGLTLQPRWGFPSDVGKAVAMLLRGDLPYSTGQSIDVGGGMEIGRL